jgi:N-acetylglucosaminyl-diphospho-decaprenol L-rhamnosyltransferase
MSGAAPQVSVLVVSYNTRELTRRCLESVRRNPPAAPYEIVVVDNASTDGSAEMLAAEPDVQLVASAVNLGFGPGVNAAAARASGDLLVLLNPDAEVLPGSFDRLLAEAGSGDIAGGAGLLPDGSLDRNSALAAPTLWRHVCFALGLSTAFPRSRLFGGSPLAGRPPTRSRRVPAVSGCFLAVRRDRWTSLGGFDDSLFLYGEDVDLCLRAAAAGAQVRFVPAAAVRHDPGSASRTRGDKVVLLLKGQVSLVERHWAPALRPVGRTLLLAGVGLRAAVAVVAQGRADASVRRGAWQVAWARRAEWSRGYPRRAAAESVTAMP